MDSLRRWLSWGILAICLALLPVSVFLAGVGEALFYCVFIIFPLIGTLIVTFRPQNIEGLVFSLGGLAWLLEGAALQYAIYGLLTEPGSLPAADLAAWLSNWLWVLEIGPLVTFALLLFPTGRLPGPRWAIVAWLAAAGILSAGVASALAPGELEGFDPDVVQNPLGLDGANGILLGFAIGGILAIAISALASAASIFVRLARSEGVERQQMKWFAYAAGLAALGVVITIIGFSISTETGENAALALVTLFGLPIAAGIAILRYRLYEIDVLINRTLVYVSLTAILAGLYTASIPLFRFLFEAVAGGGSQATIVLTTLVLAAVFTPVKNRLQTIVDRYFGRVSEPRKELTTFADQLRLVTRAFDAEQTLRQFLDHALRITNASGGAIYLKRYGDEQPFVATGNLTAASTAKVEMLTNDEAVGSLILSSADATGLRAEDLDLLRDVAGVVAEAITLAGRAGDPTPQARSPQLTV